MTLDAYAIETGVGALSTNNAETEAKGWEASERHPSETSDLIGTDEDQKNSINIGEAEDESWVASTINSGADPPQRLSLPEEAASTWRRASVGGEEVIPTNDGEHRLKALNTLSLRRSKNRGLDKVKDRVAANVACVAR
jgi:hypothetical protein